MFPGNLNNFIDEKNCEVCYSVNMKRLDKIRKSTINYILIAAVLATFAAEGTTPLVSHATTVSGLKEQIEQHKGQLEEIYNQIESLEGEQDVIQEQIDDLNSEILNTLTDIGLKEDEITAKELEIDVKQVQICDTEAEYIATKELEEEQRQTMIISTRLMYEKGASSYLSALFAITGFAEILNRLDFVEKIYSYERDRLLSYMETREQVKDLWEQLELERAQLEADRLQLEADKQALQVQKESLDSMLAEKKRESANFEAEIAKAQADAKKAKEKIQKEEKQLKELEAKLAAEAAAKAAANATYAQTSYSAIIDAAEGSELGKQMARFGCQYIGNKYVYGGNSLTNGIDCSGFTKQIYAHFGYTIPRTSLQQRSAGKSVAYADAQPGDLICYDGHVGLYIGGGLIVHASNSKPYPSGGIKVSKAQYRTILSVRRIIE